ncbi:uncharacterized protein [Aristolochia californica]|uniref:uncharacterized protein n=1 Tax=Aristolochia californica TaxID=171875 RepID=UPI0035DFCCDA
MNKLLEFGWKALFVIRVLSGYEARRIRSYRLQLQKRIEVFFVCRLKPGRWHREKFLNRPSWQKFVAWLRRCKHSTENLKKLNYFSPYEFEAAIEEYFKPIDKQAEIIMNKQLERKERIW